MSHFTIAGELHRRDLAHSLLQSNEKHMAWVLARFASEANLEHFKKRMDDIDLNGRETASLDASGLKTRIEAQTPNAGAEEDAETGDAETGDAETPDT